MRPLALAVAAAILLPSRLLAEAPPMTPPIRVLFVGNSYTSFHDMPDMVAGLQRSGGGVPPLVVETLVQPGALLQGFAESGALAGKLADERWDVVVLQEHSTLPLTSWTLHRRVVMDLHGRIREHGAQAVLLVTWPPTDRPDWQAGLLRAEVALAAEIGAAVAPVGPAWAEVVSAAPSFRLREDDDFHPSAAGAYVAACVLHAVIVGRSPEGLACRLGTERGDSVNLYPPEGELVQRIAWRVVRSTPLAGLAE